ncbi:MAG: hypothetical protein RLZZ628_1181 [Bacteroidota bacterium]|jgi:hypothetical protein
MRNFFTKLVTVNLMLGTFGAAAQTQVWPTADSATIKASQFAGDASIFTVNAANPTPPASHKGWYTKGLTSSVAAKAEKAVWQWSAIGITKGAFGGDTIVSPTAANGSAIFDSDWLDNGGNAAGSGAGQAPSIHSGELVSPIINASGQSNMTLHFNQYYRNFRSATYVSWSEDGGTTWKPKIALNRELDGNTSTFIDATEDVKLKGSVGTSLFRVKFIFEGNYYFWLVDDVKLMVFKNDLKITPFFAIAPSYVIPKNQVEDMRFLLDITNQGNVTATHTKVRFNMYRAVANGYKNIYKDSLEYGQVLANDTIQNKLLPGTLSASLLTVGRYVGQYQVVSDSVDQNPNNDEQYFDFYVQDSLYWKEAGYSDLRSPNTAAWAQGTTHPWRAGNYFYMKTGVGQTVTSLKAIVSNLVSLKGQTITAGLYEWEDTNLDGDMQSNERVLVAYADFTVPQTQTKTIGFINFQLKDVGNQKWFYPKNNKQYLAMVEFEPTSANYEMQIGYNIGESDYTAYYEMQDILYKAGLGALRYGPIMGIKSGDDWFMTNPKQIPVVQLSVVPIRVKDETLTMEHKIEVFPNPARDVATLSVDLPQLASAIVVQMLDEQGRLLQEEIFKNVQKQDLPLNISEFASGNYMLRVLTPEGTRTKKLTVVK